VLSAGAALGLGVLVSVRVANPDSISREPPRKVSIYAPSPVEDSEQPFTVTTAEGDGFILVIDSRPSEAEVTLDGDAIGSTPASVNPECAPSKGTLELELSHRGCQPARYTLECEDNVLVTVFARLKCRGRTDPR